MPAHNGPIPEDAVAAWRANREVFRAQSRGTPGGFWNEASERLALETAPEERIA